MTPRKPRAREGETKAQAVDNTPFDAVIELGSNTVAPTDVLPTSLNVTIVPEMVRVCASADVIVIGIFIFFIGAYPLLL